MANIILAISFFFYYSFSFFKGDNEEGRSVWEFLSKEEAIKFYEDAGIKVKRITLKALDYSAAAYFIISRAEAASNLARFDGVRYGKRDENAKTLNEMYCDTRHDGFGDDVRLRILVGNYVLSEIGRAHV